MSARYAIFYGPRPGSALAAFGEDWFAGHETGRALLEPCFQEKITATARRYGFHATLKAPFRLAERREPDELKASLAGFARRRRVPAAPPLALRRLDGFLALMPGAAAPEVAALAQDCVEAFEPFRAPSSADDLARHRAAGLTARQDRHLLRWGYPYVAEDFRFHITLTKRLAAAEMAAVEAALGPAVAPFSREPLEIDAVALFRQANSARNFALVERFPLDRG